jgi:hypothetical protein
MPLTGPLIAEVGRRPWSFLCLSEQDTAVSLSPFSQHTSTVHLSQAFKHIREADPESEWDACFDEGSEESPGCLRARCHDR